MIKLGDRVKDMVSGFEGIAVSRVEFLYGCKRISIEAEKTDKEGKPIEAQYFDEQRVELVETQKPAVSKQNTSKTGGPHDAPPRFGH